MLNTKKVVDSQLKNESNVIYDIYYCKDLTKENYNNRKRNSEKVFSSQSKEEILKFIKEEYKKLNLSFRGSNNETFLYFDNLHDNLQKNNGVILDVFNKDNSIRKENFGGLSTVCEHQIWDEYYVVFRQFNQNRVEFCFENGNIRLPIKIASQYSIQEIANVLEIHYKEVENQFNRMIKNSGYKLFN